MPRPPSPTGSEVAGATREDAGAAVAIPERRLEYHGASPSRVEEGRVMRKRYRTKRRSCARCKPHKRGWAPRWTAKAAQHLCEAERDAVQHARRGRETS
jgi:hypothetical protein